MYFIVVVVVNPLDDSQIDIPTNENHNRDENESDNENNQFEADEQEYYVEGNVML